MSSKERKSGRDHNIVTSEKLWSGPLQAFTPDRNIEKWVETVKTSFVRTLEISQKFIATKQSAESRKSHNNMVPIHDCHPLACVVAILKQKQS